MWVIWLNLRGTSRGVLAEESTLKLVPSFVNTDGDSYAFTAPAAAPVSVSAAQDAIALINVVPNPYFGASSYERNQFARVVRFTNLPHQAKIRIFNLLGALVRTIEKDDATSTADWDLTNRNEIPVASGMYIAYLDELKNAEGIDLGTKILKLAVIMSEERLDNF
jgi:hypothetical protein